MKEIKISSIIENPNNPRFIEDLDFEKLKKSIEEFPKMLELRPIVVNDDMVIVGGNMRYAVLKSLGYTKLPENWIKKASDFTPDELRKFIVLDNAGFGKWDYDVLKEQYSVVELGEMGVTVPHYEAVNPDDFFNDHEEDEDKDPFDDEGILAKNQYGVIIICSDEEEQQTVFNKMQGEGYKCKIVVT